MASDSREDQAFEAAGIEILDENGTGEDVRFHNRIASGESCAADMAQGVRTALAAKSLGCASIWRHSAETLPHGLGENDMRRLCSVIWLSAALLMVPIASNAQVICISNASPPPELPVYEQPPMS
jgi:hypothetical protein